LFAGGGLHFDPARPRRGDARGHSGFDHLAGVAVASAHLDPAFRDRHLGAFAVGGDGEDRAFDQRHEIGRLHPEMRSRLFLDSEGGASPILEHLDDSAFLGGGGQPKPGARRHDHIFLAADEHGAAVRARRHHVARRQGRTAHGGGGAPAMLDLDRPGRLRNPPKRHLGEGGRAPEEHQDGGGAQEHCR
jgi:hypothetical protein